MAEIQSDFGHGRNAGASTQIDATLAAFLAIVLAAFQQKTPSAVQNRFVAEAKRGESDSQAPATDESPAPDAVQLT